MADQQVNYSENNWLSIVTQHDKDHYKDDDVYEFNDGKRKFKSTDKTDSGVYDGS
jgi:hypothetical protein